MGNGFRYSLWRVWELDGNCFLGKEWPLNSVEQEGFLGPGRQLRLTYVSVFPSSFSTECPSQEMDIVFLIDGSGSIYESSFKQMKDFVRALMGHFEGTNTLVKTGSLRPGEWGASESCLGEGQPRRRPGIARRWFSGPVPWWG